MNSSDFAASYKKIKNKTGGGGGEGGEVQGGLDHFDPERRGGIFCILKEGGGSLSTFH